MLQFNSTYEALAAKSRTPQERMWEVVDALKTQSGRGALSAEQVKELMFELGMEPVDLQDDDDVDRLLQANEKITRTLDEEGVAAYAFKSEYSNVFDANSLLAAVDREGSVRIKDVVDSYAEAREDIERFVVSGEVIASQNQATHEVFLFPRRGSYLVQLSASVKANGSAASLEPEPVTVFAVTKDVQLEIRRGDAVRIGSVEWRRVSSRVSRSEKQPKRAERPLSVSSTREMHSGNEYVDPFDEARLSVVPALESPPSAGVVLFKHGCTNDVREAWLETAAHTPADPDALSKALLAANLGGSGERRVPKRASRKSHDKDAAAQPKKRRYNRTYHKITNTHLEGTAIGNILAANDERRSHQTPQA